MKEKKPVYVEVIATPGGGHALTINDDHGGYRLAGPKTTGGTVIHRFEVNPDELQRELQHLISDDS